MINSQRVENDKIFTFDSSRKCYLFDETAFQQEARRAEDARLAKKERERGCEEFQEQLSDYEEQQKFLKFWFDFLEENGEDADIDECRELYESLQA